MPKSRRAKPLYHRGGFRLDRRAGRTNLVITWYDPALGRERSVSAATAEVEDGKAALDRQYLQTTQGRAFCPACHRPFEQDGGRLVTAAMESYLAATEDRASADAIVHRIGHVTAYIGTLPSQEVYCGQVDEGWVARFRNWAMAQPIVSAGGNERPRALSTVENSVLQLAAAIRHVGERPRFKPIPMKEVNRTPRYRATLATLAAMFAYALEPKKRRENLLAFLRVSLVTLARPDAAHDVSTAPERGQWDAQHRILDLNPRGRKQTRKCRPAVPIAAPALWLFEGTRGPVVRVGSVKSAWEAMARKLRIPADGEGGMKLVRRSMAKLLRDRLPDPQWAEVEMFLGHRRFDATSDIYAPFDPNYLRNARAEIEAIIDELEALAPGAFYRDLTAQGGNVASIARGLSA